MNKIIEDIKVAIVIVNWNSYLDTVQCIKSLEEMTFANYHIFLVDNSSTDDSYSKLQLDIQNSVFSTNITLLKSKVNIGFAGGNNIGIRKAIDYGYEYFWLLNNDTEVDPLALEKLIGIISENESIGIVGSKIYYYGTKKIWFKGGIINTWIGKAKHIDMKKIDMEKEENCKSVDYITGCSLLFRKSVIEEVGFMQEDYFLYYEETDWNIRVKKNGKKILLVPDSIVYHKVSFSSGGENNLAPYVDYYYIRNSIVMIKRTQPKIKYYTTLFFKILTI